MLHRQHVDGLFSLSPESLAQASLTESGTLPWEIFSAHNVQFTLIKFKPVPDHSYLPIIVGAAVVGST